MSPTETFRVLRRETDSTDTGDEVSVPTVRKSPEAALIGGLVAGFASIAMLVLIFYVLWRTRKRTPYLSAQPEKIIPIRDESQLSTRSGYPGTPVSVETDGAEKDSGPRASRTSSRSLLGPQEARSVHDPAT
ncbi:uncharacterized protein FOMMEDRAFT_22703 [Fomitiporia mediterranea MF3/22]|uniref:uncharacterized protein n=1 Tax=Fomitiporia mediterranea (strain MF3/22) TaxID=694068 RepID=UPI00044099C8|nr:uncharacterized protein FOMMEDRAFT_22703 [Fomitiporia mediterranea MF3/22]EJD00247.1 hypothetical protein FOMMEDRAFT_22703 [Fomitiporia mediterranea MF3/22]